VYAYNVITSEWRQLASINERSLIAAVVINDTQIIMCGGHGENTDFSSCSRLTNPIDNVDAQWLNDMPDMPLAVSGHTLVYFDEHLISFGGMHRSESGYMVMYII
jgi:hypothetical protein